LSLWTYQGQFAVNVPAVLAAVILSAIPVLAAYIVGRRQLVSGLTAAFLQVLAIRLTFVSNPVPAGS